jgi:hypothetical protein
MALHTALTDALKPLIWHINHNTALSNSRCHGAVAPIATVPLSTQVSSPTPRPAQQLAHIIALTQPAVKAITACSCWVALSLHLCRPTIPTSILSAQQVHHHSCRPAQHQHQQTCLHTPHVGLGGAAPPRGMISLTPHYNCRLIKPRHRHLSITTGSALPQ